MVRYVFVGKVGPFTGKRLFEILLNLKNNGEGRYVQRLSEINNKTGKENFYKIIKASPQMDDTQSYGHVWAEQVREGKKIPFIVKLKSSLPDYKLVSKIEEKDLVKDYPVLGQSDDFINLKKNFKVPPILAEFLNKYYSKNTLNFLKYGLNKKSDGYDEESSKHFEIPFDYQFDEYEKLLKKNYID